MRGLALALALAVGAAWSSQDAIPTAATPRARPRFERMRVASPEERHLALEEWSAVSFGMEGPDPELVLASVDALCGLADNSQRAAELYDLLDGIEPLVADGAHPDLALALAQGWQALLYVGGVEIKDLDAHLEVALAAAPAIDAVDGRDSWGCMLAKYLYAVLRESGEPERARAAAEDALRRFREPSDMRASLLAVLADEDRLRGSWTIAFERLEEAEAFAKDGHPELRRTLASTRCQLEIACGLVEQAPQALEAERAAVESGATHPESRLSVLLDVAAVAMAQMQPLALQDAEAELTDALADEEQGYDERPTHRAQLRARRAALVGLLEELQPATPARAPLLLAEAFGDPALDAVHRAVMGLKLVTRARKAGDLDEARRWLDELARLELAHAELDAAITAHRALVALASGAEGEELRARAREVGDAYSAFLGRIASGPERAGGLGFLGWRDRRELLAAVVETELALHDKNGPARALEAWMREEAYGSLARKLVRSDDPPADLAAVRERLLPEGIGLLVYVPGASGVRLLCFDDARAAAFDVPWEWNVDPAQRNLRKLLSTSPDDLGPRARAEHLGRIDRLAAELGHRLLAPEVQAWIAGLRGVYVVGPELLGLVPFECLPLGARPIGLQLPIAHLPSVVVGLQLARRAKESAARESRIVLVAAPELTQVMRDQRPHLVDFRLSEADARALKSGFEHATVLEGRAATEPAWRGTLVESVAVLHFLVHGVSDGQREIPGGLALAPAAEADDGLLWCEELSDLAFISPPLVLLSACGSARGPSRPGDDGIAQLGGVFLSRGALCTVEAVSAVALAPTVRLTSVLCREVAAGRAPAVAMHAARGELARDRELAHPFYSLALRVVGLGFEPLLPARGASGNR